MRPVETSLLKETHVWNKALCLYFSFLCFPGGKWQMSGNRVGLSAPLKPCCYIGTHRMVIHKITNQTRPTDSFLFYLFILQCALPVITIMAL